MRDKDTILLESIYENIIESFDYMPEDIGENIIENESMLYANYEFEIGDYKYGMNISINKETGGGSIVFGLIESNVENPVGITKTGKSHLVFGSVANIFKSFVEKHKNDINLIQFSASLRDKSRSKLYDKLVKNSWVAKNFLVDTKVVDDVKFYILKIKHDDSDNLQK